MSENETPRDRLAAFIDGRTLGYEDFRPPKHQPREPRWYWRPHGYDGELVDLADVEVQALASLVADVEVGKP